MAATVPTIYSIAVERFRGIQSLAWRPCSGVNLILGGGDAGKTTILEAIALLLSPTYPSGLSDTDYYCRNVEDGFSIEVIIALPPEGPISNQTKPSWPWYWNGSDALVPSIDDENTETGEAVYRLRVRGTPDLELLYEIVQPDGNCDILSTSLRRSIGLVRLTGDDRNDRDLRLVQGSALDRLLSDIALRSRLSAEFSKTEVKDALTEKAKAVLTDLDAAFKTRHLPGELDLAVTGGQGFSVAALVGLTARRQEVQLPLLTWGSGTRRIASLTIAEHNQGATPVTIVDEIERGLEPYRQRALVVQLQQGSSQAFVTTHSPTAIAAAFNSGIWYVDHAGNIGSLDSVKINRLRARDPEAFLARLTVIVEGSTEVGFVAALLSKAFAPSSLEQCGIHISDGGGHQETLGVLEALAEGGLTFAGFADDEGGKHPQRWEAVRAHADKLLFRWPVGCTEQNIIGNVPLANLESLVIDPEGEKTGLRLRTLADRLGIHDKDFQIVAAKAGGDIKALIIDAALGIVPPGKEDVKKEYRAHAQVWFKSIDGGSELLAKVFSLGLWAGQKPRLLPFVNAISASLGFAPIEDIAA